MIIEPRPSVIFVDDGGTISDDRVRAEQWPRHIGEFLAPRLGSTAERWAAANRDVFPRVWADVGARMHAFATHREFLRTYDLAWLAAMCEAVGVSVPDEAEAMEIARGAHEYVSARVHAPIAGAVDAVRALRDAGYELHTASGTPSRELEASLALLGIRGCFGRLFGADLVDVPKGSPEFYRRIFAALAIDSTTALVIDDSERACVCAREVGARAVLIRDTSTDGAGEWAARSLAEVASWLVPDSKIP
ncbi:MAG TPA: HAD family hydrolase [Longimicrobium sp.]|nr:HAD family hydrolase [Longimicrobium sp.]